MRPLVKLLLGVVALSPATGARADDVDKSGYTLFNPTPRAAMRDMATDRPDKTESPYSVDAGHVQIETDLVAFTRDRADGVTVETLDVAPFNFKVGLTNTTDIQLVYGSFSRVRTQDDVNAVTTTERGGGDLTIRLKHNLWGNDGGRTALALMPYVKVPTNTLAGLNDDVEGGLIVPLAIELAPRIGLGLMTEVDILREERADGWAPTFVNTATLAFDLTDKLGLFTEVYVERSSEDGSDTIVTFDAGLTYAVTDDLQLDAGTYIGLTDAADDWTVFAGLSQRF